MERLQWKTTHKLDFNEESDFLESMLHDYGVTNIKTFLHPKKEDELDPFLFKNMKKAVKQLYDFLQTDKIVLIKGDCDVDGATSLSIIVQLIKELKPDVKIIYKTNFNKRHGLFFSDLNELSDEEKNNLGLIIVPDASVSLEESGKIRKEDAYVNIPIIVLDHHDLSEEMDTITTTTVNCMDGEYPNNTLSGAGVVYKFGEAYCDKYNLDRELIEKYIDLASVGIISDSMDLKNPETRYIVTEGLKEKNHRNLFLNELQELFKEDMKFGRTITSVGWVIAPKINGVIRYGKQKEQEDLFRAICGEKEDIEYQPRRKHKEDPKPDIEIQTLQKAMARISNNVKSRQDTEVRKFVEKLDEKIVKENLLNNSILFIDGSDLVTKNTVTGLIANKLASKYYRPVVLLKEFTSDTFGGSGRGYDKGAIENFKTILNESGLFNKAEGHESACGIEILKDKVNEAISYFNKKIPIESLCTVYPVDWEIEAVNLKETYVQEVAENYEIWGNTVPEPLFAIKNLHINASNINGYGDNNGFIRFIYKGIPFIKKYCAHDDFEKMTCWTRNIMGKNKKDITLNLICQFVLNSWEDKITPQVKILYFDSVENVEKVGLKDSGNTIVKSNKKTTTAKKNELIKNKNDESQELENNLIIKKKELEDDFEDFIF